MTMNKKEFIEYVRANIKSYLPDYIKDGCQIELIEVTKNNDITLTGLNFNRGEGVPSPNFYFEPAYEAYCDGHTVEELLENLAECAVNSWEIEIPIDLETATYADIKDKLTYQVVDVLHNRGRLINCPHTMMGNDLALIYYIEVPQEDGIMRALVSHGMMKDKGFEEATLKYDAKLNMEKIHEPVMLDMGNASVNLLEQEAESSGRGLYMLTNKEFCCGASTMFYDGVKDRIAEVIKGDYYILPSSIHEVMIVPAEGANVSRLAEIIRDANETVVTPDEFLSNRLFSYDHKGKNLVEHVVPLARTIDDMER
ncbi:MAG: hypothetical protein IKC98_02900 [Firmicutes bacterium]|nr:hypothetical protein [Bacillota bacterium]